MKDTDCESDLIHNKELLSINVVVLVQPRKEEMVNIDHVTSVCRGSKRRVNRWRKKGRPQSAEIEDIEIMFREELTLSHLSIGIT